VGRRQNREEPSERATELCCREVSVAPYRGLVAGACQPTAYAVGLEFLHFNESIGDLETPILVGQAVSPALLIYVRILQKIAPFSSAGRLPVPDLATVGFPASRSRSQALPLARSRLRGAGPRFGSTLLRTPWLRYPAIGDLMAEAIVIGQDERQFYELCAWLVMPNHVHLLILPAAPAAVLMRWLKGSTARQANQILGRTGRPFWQDESFDHYLRRPDQVSRTAAYIEQNPVCAGLVRSAEDWRWSSAGWQAKPPAPPRLPTHRVKM